MNIIGETIGEICKIILPIPEEVYYGNKQSRLAVCTLSSMNLLKKIANSDILDNIAVAGRLLSENKGIDSMLDYFTKNQNITTLIICGKEVWGHKAGHSLVELYKNGLDDNNRIINSNSPDPYITSLKYQVEYFQNSIQIVNLIGDDNFEHISTAIRNI